MQKIVYMFFEGNKDMKNLLGGKGANLCEMTNLGLPVPEGFIISTEGCGIFNKNRDSLTEDMQLEISSSLEKLEKITGRELGGKNPLFLSVRSGAPISMPGMMDTVLNLGFNDETVETAAEIFKDKKFAYESYARFIEMFSDIVKKLDREHFIQIDKKLENELKKDSIEFSVEKVKRYKEYYGRELKQEFPQNPKEQLQAAIEAIFLSWNNERARVYRQLNDIDENMGTAVNIQRMVFGNLNSRSATGVAFSRNPANGENNVFGEYILHAQGEDIVAGIATPMPLEHMRESLPEIYNEFTEMAKKLERHYRDMQDIEFTVEDGKLFILQTRSGKRSPLAGVKIALDFLDEEMIDEETAIMRVNSGDISKLLKGTFKSTSLKNAKNIGKGLAGSAGVATGKAIFSSDRITGSDSILVRNETSPDDLKGMSIASGILTAKGGLTSHGAVVARGMGKCCVAGCSEMIIDLEKREFLLGGVKVREGDLISIDGYTGNIYLGAVEIDSGKVDTNFERILQLAIKNKRMGVRMNADTPEDCRTGLRFHAEGIGLCRTEHMFFKEDRIWAVREMILSRTLDERKKALDKILPYQEQDFFEMMELLDGKIINIRLLDPPLHEFLPNTSEEMEKMAALMKLSLEETELRVKSLEEHNPMLGHRGCRLAVTFPEIYETQVKAITGAGIRCQRKGIKTDIEIMIPLISERKELIYVKEKIEKAIEIAGEGREITYRVGTMIELPRACVVADELAAEADFFSFGTNDLTQTSFGLSRDDSGKFIEVYKEKGIYEKSPFEVLDREGVVKLMKIAVSLGRERNPKISIGICGEHGGEPKSISICEEMKLDYVSCSPFRVPAAILAAAQSYIREKNRILEKKS